MRPLLLPLAVLLATAGCREAPPEAPTELDDLVHFFWQQMDGTDAALVGEGGDNFATWYDGTEVDDGGWSTGMVSELDGDEVALLDRMEWEPEPALAVGVYIALETACTWDQMMTIYLEPDQLELFPGNYDAYERHFDSDPDCFFDESCDVVDWHSDYEDSIVGLSMSYLMYSRMRRFWYEDAGGDETQVILGRNYMPAAADENIATAGFEQSYHIEAYVPRGPDHTLHLYALWNYGYIEGVDDDVAFWPNQYLDGLIEWDERIQELCTEVL